MSEQLASVFQAKGSLLPVCLQTAVIYLFLVAGFRLLGRRQMAQLNPVDQLSLLMLGTAVQNTMLAGDNSLPAGLASCATLFAVNGAFNALLIRYKRFRHWMLGGPTLVVHHGQYVASNLRRLSLTEADVDEALRKRGFGEVSDIRFAVMEPDGEINVVPRHSGGELRA